MGTPRNRKAAGGATSSARDRPMTGNTPARRACATVAAAAAAAAAGEAGTAAGAGLPLLGAAEAEDTTAAADGAAGVLACRAAVGGRGANVRGESPSKEKVGGQEAEFASPRIHRG